MRKASNKFSKNLRRILAAETRKKWNRFILTFIRTRIQSPWVKVATYRFILVIKIPVLTSCWRAGTETNTKLKSAGRPLINTLCWVTWQLCKWGRRPARSTKITKVNRNKELTCNRSDQNGYFFGFRSLYYFCTFITYRRSDYGL